MCHPLPVSHQQPIRDRFSSWLWSLLKQVMAPSSSEAPCLPAFFNLPPARSPQGGLLQQSSAGASSWPCWGAAIHLSDLL